MLMISTRHQILNDQSVELYLLGQRSANFLRKDPDSKYFKVYGYVRLVWGSQLYAESLQVRLSTIVSHPPCTQDSWQ